MRKPRNYEQWQVDFIKENASKMSLSQLSEKLNIPAPTLQKYCDGNKIVTKWAHQDKKEEYRKPEPKLKRPPAIYTQTPSPYRIADRLHNISLTA